MKKIYFFSLLFFLSIEFSFAQLQSFTAGQTAPDFTITDSRGNTHTLYQYTNAGKYVLLDFFTFWCGPCMATAPKIDEFYKKYGCNSGNVAVLGIEGDGNIDSLHHFDEQAGLDSLDSYPAASGIEGNGAAVHTAYGPSAFPTIALIGPDKKFIDTDVWPISTIADIEAAFPNGAITPMNCPTGINEKEISGAINFYPNPVSNLLTVSLEKNFENISYEITDVIGKNIIKNNLALKDNKLVVDISRFPAGIYFLKINDEKRISTSRLVIAR